MKKFLLFLTYFLNLYCAEQDDVQKLLSSAIKISGNMSQSRQARFNEMVRLVDGLNESLNAVAKLTSFQDNNLEVLLDLFRKRQFTEACIFLKENSIGLSGKHPIIDGTILDVMISNLYNFNLSDDQIKNLFELLVEKNEFTNNLASYQKLKKLICEEIELGSSLTCSILKLHFDIFKMIKEKLKRDIEATYFQQYLSSKSSELNCLPKQLISIIGEYLSYQEGKFMGSQKIPIDLYSDLCSEQVESLFKQYAHSDDLCANKHNNCSRKPSKCVIS